MGWTGRKSAPSFARLPIGIIQQLDTGILKTDSARFVKFAQCLLEGLLAHVELLPNCLRRTVIIERQLATTCFQGFDNLLRQRRDPFIAGSIEAQVNLIVRADVTNKRLQSLPDLERRGDIVPVEQAQVRILNDGLVTERTGAGDKQIHRLTVAIKGSVVTQMPLESSAGHNAFGLRI